jgi:MoaA/NifB/PqqE/SkfB family radical SAM enzyme
MMKKTIFGILLMFVLFVGLYGCASTEKGYKVDNAYVTLDINPSVEIITGENGLVVEVNALNDDAQVLLVDTNFTGKTVDETVEAIVALAKELGYLDVNEENAIVVTAEAENANDTEELENKINERIWF